VQKGYKFRLEKKVVIPNDNESTGMATQKAKIQGCSYAPRNLQLPDHLGLVHFLFLLELQAQLRANQKFYCSLSVSKPFGC
jgi:hypothetical protein